MTATDGLLRELTRQILTLIFTIPLAIDTTKRFTHFYQLGKCADLLLFLPLPKVYGLVHPAKNKL